MDEEQILKQVVSEHDPAMMVTGSGRLKRWVKLPYEPVYPQKNSCSTAKLPQDIADLNFIHSLDKYEQKLFDNLTVRARAIRNWKHIKNKLMMLVVFRI